MTCDPPYFLAVAYLLPQQTIGLKNISFVIEYLDPRSRDFWEFIHFVPEADRLAALGPNGLGDDFWTPITRL